MKQPNGMKNDVRICRDIVPKNNMETNRSSSPSPLPCPPTLPACLSSSLPPSFLPEPPPLPPSPLGGCLDLFCLSYGCVCVCVCCSTP